MKLLFITLLELSIIKSSYREGWWSRVQPSIACSFGWAGSLLVREEVLLADLCERKILFRLKIYDRIIPAEQAARGLLGQS